MTDLLGRPVARQRLSLYEYGAGQSALVGSSLTDLNGRFEFRTIGTRLIPGPAATGRGVTVRWAHDCLVMDSRDPIAAAWATTTGGRRVWSARGGSSSCRVRVPMGYRDRGLAGSGVYFVNILTSAGAATVRMPFVGHGGAASGVVRGEPRTVAPARNATQAAVRWLIVVESGASQTFPGVAIESLDTTVAVRLDLPMKVTDTATVVFLSTAPDSASVPIDQIAGNDGYFMVETGDSLRYAASVVIGRPRLSGIVSTSGATAYVVQERRVYDAEHFITTMFGVRGTPEELRETFGPFTYGISGYSPGSHACWVSVRTCDAGLIARFVPLVGPLSATDFGQSRETRTAIVEAFLASDSTDTTTYRDTGYVCADYARDLCLNALAHDIPMYVVSAMQDDGQSHSFNGVLVGDSLMSRRDWLFIEPQDDNFRPGGKPVDEYLAQVSYFHVNLVKPSAEQILAYSLLQGTRDTIRTMAQPFSALGLTLPTVRDSARTIDRALDALPAAKGVLVVR